MRSASVSMEFFGKTSKCILDCLGEGHLGQKLDSENAKHLLAQV